MKTARIDAFCKRILREKYSERHRGSFGFSKQLQSLGLVPIWKRNTASLPFLIKKEILVNAFRDGGPAISD